MNITFKSYRLAITLIMILAGNYCFAQQNEFVVVKQQQFFNTGKPMYFIGTNYWYGGLLGLQKDSEKGIDRLKKELDFLLSNGVLNLRVLAGAEGAGLINGVDRVGPALQKSKAVFDTNYLSGLDLLLSEMGKRNMKAVIILSNNWEWSGGFLQYLQWNGLINNEVLKKKISWDDTRDYVSKFYSCEPCKADYLAQLKLIISRTNSITSTKYSDDPAIMAWELANEPRPMRPSAIKDYKNWISTSASFIKENDKNHLVTIGTEGYIGTENLQVYESIHADKNIDYLTIHIWPKNWEWFKGKAVEEGLDSVFAKSKKYISDHLSIAERLRKPLVIEEFGLPRDGHSFDQSSSTTARDNYYAAVFTELLMSRKKDGALAGAAFWSYGGSVKPKQLMWKSGDQYIGDPPMEEQGLNAVFDDDTSTWRLIQSIYDQLKLMAPVSTGTESIMQK